MFTMGSLRRAKEDERTSVNGLLELLGLGAVADRTPLGLPLGWARLVELGRALATSPTVLLLDEPSAGLDSSETEQFESSLLSVTRERGISVLLVEHDVELVMRICSTVNVLDFGILIANGSPDEVQTNPKSAPPTWARSFLPASALAAVARRLRASHRPPSQRRALMRRVRSRRSAD